MRILSVAVGGAIGAVARYTISHAVAVSNNTSFPWGTLVVNVLGCLLIGLLMEGTSRLAHRPDLQAMLVTGLLGAMTTFSTFSLETVILFQRESWVPALANIALNLTLGVAAVIAGGLIARQLAKIA